MTKYQNISNVSWNDKDELEGVVNNGKNNLLVDGFMEDPEGIGSGMVFVYSSNPNTVVKNSNYSFSEELVYYPTLWEIIEIITQDNTILEYISGFRARYYQNISATNNEDSVTHLQELLETFNSEDLNDLSEKIKTSVTLGENKSKKYYNN